MDAGDRGVFCRLQRVLGVMTKGALDRPRVCSARAEEADARPPFTLPRHLAVLSELVARRLGHLQILRKLIDRHHLFGLHGHTSKSRPGEPHAHRWRSTVVALGGWWCGVI